LKKNHQLLKESVEWHGLGQRSQDGGQKDGGKEGFLHPARHEDKGTRHLYSTSQKSDSALSKRAHQLLARARCLLLNFFLTLQIVLIFIFISKKIEEFAAVVLTECYGSGVGLNLEKFEFVAFGYLTLFDLFWLQNNLA
jgi:hypothetical protein